RALWAPAIEHARGGPASEDADQRHTASRGDVLAGRIVAYVETAAGDDLREGCERAFPECGSDPGGCAFHPRCFFSTRAFIDHQRRTLPQHAQQLYFKRIRDPL